MNDIKDSPNHIRWFFIGVACLLCLLPIKSYCQSIGTTVIPFDPIKLLPKTNSNPADTVQTRTIKIIHSNELQQQTDTLTNIITRKLVGAVRLSHEGAIMTCDTATLYPQSNYLQASGNIRITKGDSILIRSKILKYDGNTQIANLERDVKLKDKESLLTAPTMTYDVGKDIGYFWNQGKLTTDSTTLTSDHGTYYQRQGYAIFKQHVVLKNPDYTMYADSLKYQTQSKVAYFITQTTIISNGDTLTTSEGHYDTRSKKLFLKSRSQIKSKDENTLSADVINFDKIKGTGEAQGAVISRNIKDNISLITGHLYHSDSNQYSRADLDPLMIKYDEKDTLYLSADTLINFTYPLSKKIQDSLKLTEIDTFSKNYITLQDTILSKKYPAKESLAKDSISSLSGQNSLPKITDTTQTLQQAPINTTAHNDSIKVFYGYRHVKLLRSNLSGICDSIHFDGRDSIFKLYYQPVLWVDSTQLKSDSIYIYMKNKQAEKVDLFDQAIIIQEEDSGIFNQISGRKITAHLKNNKIKTVYVDGNAESIYFLKNDSNQYLGGNRAKSALITISFNDSNKVQKIKLETSPEAKFTPIQIVDYKAFQLPQFAWYWSLKPQSKWDVIRDSASYQKYLFEYPEKPIQQDSSSHNPMDIDSTNMPPMDRKSVTPSATRDVNLSTGQALPPEKNSEMNSKSFILQRKNRKK